MATRRLYPGQPANVAAASVDMPTDDMDEAPPPNGEIVAPRPSELALRLWQRVPGLTPGRLAPLRIAVEHHTAVYFAESSPVEPPYPGETFWAPVPLEWTRVDRRLAYRLPVDVPVRVHLPGTSVPALRRLLDLSASGCRVERLTAETGTEVEMRFGLLPSAVEMRLRARVVHSGGQPPETWTALTFVDLDSANEERISRFLLDEERRRLGPRL